MAGLTLAGFGSFDFGRLALVALQDCKFGFAGLAFVALGIGNFGFTFVALLLAGLILLLDLAALGYL